MKNKAKIIMRQIYENFPWGKQKKPNLPEKPDCNGVALSGNGVALSGNIFSTLISMAKSV